MLSVGMDNEGSKRRLDLRVKRFRSKGIIHLNRVLIIRTNGKYALISVSFLMISIRLYFIL